MILDSLENLPFYTCLNPGIKTVCEYIQNNDLQNLSEGKHLLDAGVYVSVNKYMTKLPENGFIETHKKYIDIQIITQGIEKVGYVPLSKCNIYEEIEEKDLLKMTGDDDSFVLKPDMFCIFFPQDGHKPNLQFENEAVEVKKLVFKLPVITE